MNAGPPLSSISAVDEAREGARRQAQSLSSSLLVVFGMIAAVVAMVLFAVLDYGFGQDPHRLVKIALGVALLAAIVMKPKMGLFFVPLLMPFILKLPKMPIPGVNTLNILMGTIFLSFALGRIVQHQPLLRNGVIGKRLLLLLLMNGLWIFRGLAFPTGYEYNPLQAGIELFRCFMTFMVYFVTLSMTRGERDRRMLMWGLVLGLLLESLVTIKMGRNYRMRAAGTIDQPNDLGAYLAMFTPLCVALFFAVRGFAPRMLLLIAAAAGVFSEILTVSRGGILAMAVALGYVSLRSSRALTLFLVVALLTSPVWAPDYLKDRITGTQVADQSSDEVEFEGGTQDRIETWRTIATLVENHPLDGVGYMGLSYVLGSIGSTLPMEIKDSAHNTYLRMLGELGLPGLLLFLWLLWTAWRLSLRAGRVAGDRFGRQMAIGYGAAVIALVISCMFGDRFYQVTIGGNFWVYSALITDLALEKQAGAA